MSCPHCSKVKTQFCPQCGEKRPQMTKEQKLAEAIHNMFCTSNHIDGCGWCYEVNWGKGTTHARYLKIAQGIRKKYSEDEIVTSLSLLGFIKGEL